MCEKVAAGYAAVRLLPPAGFMRFAKWHNLPENSVIRSMKRQPPRTRGQGWSVE
jgi:hypothetical protein